MRNAARRLLVPGRAHSAFGLTLVELIMMMVVSGILFVATPSLILYGVKTLVFLPKALAVNHVAVEVLQQVAEGGFSTLPGRTAPVRGLRFAIRIVPIGGSQEHPAIWLAEANRIGFLTSDGEPVLIRLDGEVIKRSLPPASATCLAVPAPLTEESIPYYASGSARMITTGALFQYYNQSGGAVSYSCPPSAMIRRVDMAFTAQTGDGVFEHGEAQEQVYSSVAVRVP